ncbi:unnamed protein product [Ectocarpus sp. CCAP 1310/34]|nr:unnamed protein product [Ectocarpus sp. CCAP 1310/34]
MPQREEDAGPGVDQLRQEVATLRRDVDTIRSTMQDMHREVGSAVLLLSRFVGLQWNTDEVVGLVEDKTALASEAVDRLADNVGTLQQRLTIAEETKLGGTRSKAATSIDEASVPDAAATMVEQESCFTEFGAGCNSSTPRCAADESTPSPSSSSPLSSSSWLPSLPRDMDMGGSASGRVVSAPGRREDAEDAEDAESAAGSGDKGKRTDGQLLLDAAGEGYGASLTLSRTNHIDENGQQPSASKLPPLRTSRSSSVAIDDGDGTGMATAPLLPKERQGGLSRCGELAAAPSNTNCSREEIESEDATANCKGFANPPVGAVEDRAETAASPRQSTTPSLQRLTVAAEAADGAAVATNEANGSAGQMDAEDALMRGGRRKQNNGVNEVVERNINPESSQRTPVQPSHVRASSEIAVGIAGDAVSTTSRKGTLVPIRDSNGDENEQGSGEDNNETPTASERGGAQTNIATPSALLRTRKRSASSGRLLDPWVSTGETSALVGENGKTTRELKGKDEEQGRMGDDDGEQRQSNLAAGANGNAETTAPIDTQGGPTLLPKEFRGLAGETIGGTTPGGRSSLLGPVQPRPAQARADNAMDTSETGGKSNIPHNSAQQASTSSFLSEEARQSQSIKSNEGGGKERSTPPVTERAEVTTVEGLTDNNSSGGEREDSSQTSSGSSFTGTTSDSRGSSFSEQQSTTTSTATSTYSRAANGGSSDSGRRRGRWRASSASRRDHIEEVAVTGGGGNPGSTEVDSGLSSFTLDRPREISEKGGEAADGDTVSGGGGEGGGAVITPRSKSGHRQQ